MRLVCFSHYKYGKVNLTSREALNTFISDNELNSGNTIQIIIIDPADCMGAEPKEL